MFVEPLFKIFFFSQLQDFWLAVAARSVKSNNQICCIIHNIIFIARCERYYLPTPRPFSNTLNKMNLHNQSAYTPLHSTYTNQEINQVKPC